MYPYGNASTRFETGYGRYAMLGLAGYVCRTIPYIPWTFISHLTFFINVGFKNGDATTKHN